MKENVQEQTFYKLKYNMQHKQEKSRLLLHLTANGHEHVFHSKKNKTNFPSKTSKCETLNIRIINFK